MQWLECGKSMETLKMFRVFTRIPSNSKNLYVWCLESKQLMKVLDAHFGRIIQLESLTIGSWNSVITSSIDRSVKIWNINNIFEEVHVIDRHELQIDSIR